MPQFHLIAPSGYCINQEAAQRGVQRLLEMGHQVENQTIIPRRMQRFAGTEAQRLSDINSLATLEGENTIVLAVRGGYGASRLLESIDWAGLAARRAAGSAVNLRTQRFHGDPARPAGVA